MVEMGTQPLLDPADTKGASRERKGGVSCATHPISEPKPLLLGDSHSEIFFPLQEEIPRNDKKG